MNPPRALLLTDVVDSTRLSHTLGDAGTVRLWAEHDRAARALLHVWRGREIEKTDGLLALFDQVADAAGFALAYHRALAALTHPLAARAGIHWGPVALRESDAADAALGAKRFEVDGLAKPTTARVMAIALGGQTLLTAEARAALGPVDHRVQSHGHWRLKGVPEPIELFEIGAFDRAADGAPPAPFTPPPDDEKAWRVVREREVWLPVRDVRHSVPAERDSFVGRAESLQALAHKLEGGARLVSVLGIGGTGKTRLVTRFAWTWLGDYPGGVWFCDLSQARGVDGIHFAVAQGLDVPLGQTDPVVQLAHAIAGRGKCLVILDNFEQVARHAEETLGHWLDRAPQAQFVVTTREVLGIVGEETLGLAPLPADDAAALFRRRAEAALRDFAPSADDTVAIAQLVKVLDGLPLAIELAAARVRVMPPRALLARMSERFKLLWSAAGRQDRQATLRAAFDWSWELLSGPEKIALAQLSVFEGGFSLESAEAVLDLGAGGLTDAETPWVVDAVQWLVDKSFVRQVGDSRFDLLESVRDYAGEHLRTEGRYPGSGAAAALAAQQRHWRYFAALDERAAVAGGCIEANNLVVACRRATAAGQADAAVGALVNAWAALRLSGPFGSAAQLASCVLEMPGLPPARRAWAEWVSASALDLCGDVHDARVHGDRGLALARAAADRPCEVRLVIRLASQQSNQGQHDAALAGLTQALALSQTIAHRGLECLARNALGRLCDHRSRLTEARDHYEAGLALSRELRDRRLEGGLLGNLGGLHHTAGRLDEAARHYELALELAREVGDRQWEGNARCNLGLVHHEQGDARRAQTRFEEALDLARAIGHRRLECTVTCNLGIVLDAQGRTDEARTHYENAVAGARELGDGRLEGQTSGYLGVLLARARCFAESRACLAAGEQLLLASGDELSLALLLCGRAESDWLADDAAGAETAYRRAQRLARDVRVGDASELGQALTRIGALLGLAVVR